MNMPDFVAHADWGTNPKKYQVAVAEQIGEGRYDVVSLGPVSMAIEI
jgi:hypothetical protein